MLQKKTFIGGINSDASSEAMPPGMDRYRLNVRTLSSDNGEELALETIKGNTLVSHLLPAGTNKCIGYYEDKKTGKGYGFIHNSLLSHSIIEYNQATNTIANVLVDTNDTYLRFKTTNLITGISVVELNATNHLLYWTDNWVDPNDKLTYNEPKKLNIEKAKFYTAGNYTDGYKFPLDERIPYRIKQPPLCNPTYVWSGVEETEPVLQFEAGSSSGDISISPSTPSVPLPYDLDPSAPGDGYNTITLTFTIPSDGEYSFEVGFEIENFIGVNIAGIDLYINGSLFATIPYPISGSAPIFDTVVFSSILLNAGDEVYCGAVMIGGSAGDTYLIRPIAFRSYLIPSQTSAKINFLFKQLYQFKVQFVYDDYEVSAWSPISQFVMPNTTADNQTGEDIVRQDNLITITVPTGSSIVTKIRIAGREIGVTDGTDPIDFAQIVELDKSELAISDDTTYDYEFRNFGGSLPLELKSSNSHFDRVPIRAQSEAYFYGNRIGDGEITEGFDAVPIDMRTILNFPLVDTNENKNFPKVSHLKSGGQYTLGIVYYDYWGNRSSLTNITRGRWDEFNSNTGLYGTTLSIPFLTEDTYNAPHNIPNDDMAYIPVPTLNVYSKPPKWAKHYQIVRSKNQTMGRYLQFAVQTIVFFKEDGTVTIAPYEGTQLGIFIINITDRFKDENPNSHVVYDFVPGDRIRFIADVAYGSFAPLSPQSNDEIQAFIPYADFVIMSYDSGTGAVMIKNTQDVPFSTAGGSSLRPGMMVEIYQPNHIVDAESQLFYEMGECYEIEQDANGEFIHAGGDSNQILADFSASVYLFPNITITVPVGHGFLAGNEVKLYGDDGFTSYGIATTTTATSITIDTTGFDILGIVTGPGYISSAAVTTLSSGDTFRRTRNMPWVFGGDVYRLYQFVEDANVSDVFESIADSIGRTNRVDDSYGMITRPSTIYYSEPFIPETFINGLSTVYEDNFEMYSELYGGIKYMRGEGYDLRIFQQLRTGKIPVEQIQISDTQGQQFVGKSEKVLSKIAQYYTGEWGIGNNPESHAFYGKTDYFIDPEHGLAIRWSNDGLTPISEVFFQHKFFTEKLAKTRKATGGNDPNIYGTYDAQRNKYVVFFDSFNWNNAGVITLEPADCIEFDEKYNAFSSHFSIFPDFVGTNGTGYLAFKAGQIYTQETNPLHANFFGVQYQPEFWCVMNDNPSNVKVLEAISVESANTWEVYSITNIEGQETNLIVDDFTIIEGQQYAPLWRDVNTPNVTNPLIEGDVMRSRTFLVKFRYTGTDYSKVNAVNLKYIISNLHNR